MTARLWSRVGLVREGCVRGGSLAEAAGFR